MPSRLPSGLLAAKHRETNWPQRGPQRGPRKRLTSERPILIRFCLPMEERNHVSN